MTALAQAAAPGIRGFVEAAGPDRILGWAWNSTQPALRLLVELRDGNAVLARQQADQPRPDLAANGVGDGAHAFVFDLPDTLAPRATALQVVAIGADGEAVPLGVPPAAAEPARDTRRVLDSLVASQRVLHRNLQAVLLAAKAREPADAIMAGIVETQAALHARTAELEGFVLRLDERLARMDAPRAMQAGRAGLLGLRAAVAIAAAGFAAVSVHLFR